MMRSVFNLPAVPKTTLTGSSTASFITTSLLPSISNRNRVPGSIPKALRIGPGIVTCPFSVTVKDFLAVTQEF